MPDGAWIKNFPVAVIVCDTQGTIIEMNDKALKGRNLLGQSIIDCHPEPVRDRVVEMLREGKGDCYTTERNGIKKLIYIAPWYKEGVYSGLVELATEIPFEMPHIIKKSTN